MSHKYRKDAKVDANQKQIVKELRQLGFSVEINHDDILVGWLNMTFWYELKAESAISKKTGKILESKIKPSQKKLRAEWKGHYKIATTSDEIVEDMMRYNPRK